MSAVGGWESSGGWELGGVGAISKEGTGLGVTRDSVEVAVGTGGGGINEWAAEGSDGGSEVLESASGGDGNIVGSVGSAGRTSGAGGCDGGACNVEAAVAGVDISKKARTQASLRPRTK